MSDEVKPAPAGIDAAMLAVMREIGAIGKTQKNTQQNFNYRGIADIYDAAHAAMANNGVYMLPELLSHTREERATKSGGSLIYTFMTVRYRFVAGDGSYQECVVPGEGMDSGDKSSNKALAAAHKYAITQSFVIPYSEMVDGDAETPEQNTKGNPPPAATKKPPGKVTGKPLPEGDTDPRLAGAQAFAQGALAELETLLSARQMAEYFAANKPGLNRLAQAYPDLWANVFIKRISQLGVMTDIDDALREQAAALSYILNTEKDVHERIGKGVSARRMQINPFGEEQQ